MIGESSVKALLDAMRPHRAHGVVRTHDDQPRLLVGFKCEHCGVEKYVALMRAKMTTQADMYPYDRNLFKTVQGRQEMMTGPMGYVYVYGD